MSTSYEVNSNQKNMFPACIKINTTSNTISTIIHDACRFQGWNTMEFLQVTRLHLERLASHGRGSGGPAHHSPPAKDSRKSSFIPQRRKSMNHHKTITAGEFVDGILVVSQNGFKQFPTSAWHSLLKELWSDFHVNNAMTVNRVAAAKKLMRPKPFKLLQPLDLFRDRLQRMAMKGPKFACEHRCKKQLHLLRAARL